jgi:hypothetical protein
MGIEAITAFLLTCDNCQLRKPVYKPTKREVYRHAATALGWFAGGNLLFCSKCKAKMKQEAVTPLTPV